MTPTTPSGTRTRSTRSPFGRTQPSTTWPTGSGKAATWRRPSAMAATRSARGAAGRCSDVGGTFGARPLEVGAVVLEHLGATLLEQVASHAQGTVLGRPSGHGQSPGSHLGATAEIDDVRPGHAQDSSATPRPVSCAG